MRRRIDGRPQQMSERVRQQARAAAMRAQMSRYDDRTHDSRFTIFGDRRERSTVGSILDLLSTIID